MYLSVKAAGGKSLSRGVLLTVGGEGEDGYAVK